MIRKRILAAARAAAMGQASLQRGGMPHNLSVSLAPANGIRRFATGMMRHTLRAAGILAAALATIHIAQAQTTSTDADQALIDRGHYLATAADCAACHTVKGGQPFAGGYPIVSPLGTIYSSNITPSKTAGIGAYSEADFARALRDGVRRDGSHLYPAMPYTSYAGMSDDDVKAMYAWFMHSVTPVDTPAPQTSLPFPFSVRASMGVWNMMFLDKQRFTPQPSETAEVGRGRYLVDNLAHCAECHTPRNAMMALDKSADLTGGAVGSWYAPNITADPVKGIGKWTDAQITTYLKTGHVAGLAQAAGPMAEAVTNSLQYLSDSDLQAIVAYLRTKKTAGAATSDTSASTQKNRADFGHPLSADAQYRGIVADASSGAQLYSGNCAACHRADGSGSPNGVYPSLIGNTAVGANTPDNLVATILYGVDRTVAGKQILMPGFGPHAYVNQLSNQEIAELSNYIFTQYGNPAVHVTAQDVATIAQGGPTPLIAKLGQYAAGAIAVVIVIIVLLLVWLMVRRRSRRPRA